MNLLKIRNFDLEFAPSFPKMKRVEIVVLILLLLDPLGF